MLIFNSLIIIFLTVTFQAFPYGNNIDFVTPLLVAVGMTSTRKRAILWVIFMSIIWSPLTRFPFILILIIWTILILLINFLSSKLRWDILTAGLFIAPITSLTWNFLLLYSTYFFGFTPTIDTQIYFSFFIRSISTVILTILFWNLLTGKTSSEHPLSLRDKSQSYTFIK